MTNQKTGTTTIGIVCKDGVVIAADRKVTSAYIVHKKFKKIMLLNKEMAVTTAGTVSDAQLMVKLLQAEMKLKEIQTARKNTVKETANLLSGLLYQNMRKMSMVPGISSHLLGGKDDQGYHLYHVDADGAVLEYDDYTACGSGETFVIGYLENNYKEGLSVDEGVKLVQTAINASLQRDIYSGAGIDVVKITQKGAEFTIDKEVKIIAQ